MSDAECHRHHETSDRATRTNVPVREAKNEDANWLVDSAV